jgi:hypothetical protein
VGICLSLAKAVLELAEMTRQEVTSSPELGDSEPGWNEKSMENDGKPRYQDAFGDESNAEVKYKTMEWW